ncbi:YkvA family protein [Heliophilum fasciatum]|uniref:Uncharacterized protein DUF1232 n=1 Tax=Heliophilum fasciatum TaxID=35700 RepID=A0A4R2RIA0_9FIRM|nr:DUF1232 domain-containing protein [Heliophilum fasciatum]MCW2278547.1 uncharacterized membrane protein YkvA (DUF1232 family) [Heliophilum fasciatum]TCP63502.1 uncharacterized protein DUF1232 [Heliophilum fasciatum]
MRFTRRWSFWQRLRLWFDLPRTVRLIYALLRDERVPVGNKLLFLAVGATYFLLPFDVLPDILPLVGQIDDATVLLLLLDRFIAAAPTYVVDEYLQKNRR